MNKRLSRFFATSIREVVFGIEDSLVSTLGTVTGVAVGSQDTYIVILSGIVLIFSEATSMAAGSYLSSKSALSVEEAIEKGKPDHKGHLVEPKPIKAAAVMGSFYFVGGIIPLLPYFFYPISFAMVLSVGLTAASLFLHGLFVSRFTKRPALRSGFNMLIISFVAAGLGYLVGRLVSMYFGVEVPA